MATHKCNQNCGCKDTYTVTAPCPPACPEVFNSQCIVYTGTDIICNTDTVIKRYDYLDTVITKLVNYICSVQAPVTQVVGSTYIDVVPATVGNITTYTVSVDVAQLDVYFSTAFQNDLFASILAGPGIAVATNALTGTVTISHQDTSAVNNLNSDNSGNTFIQDIAFAFDTFGHVTGASVVAASVTPPNDYLNVQIFPDSPSYVWGTNNNSTDIQTAQSPADTLNVVAGSGIVLNASTVPGTEAIRITNSAPDQIVGLTAGAGINVTGTYPNFTLTNTDLGSNVSLSSVGSGANLITDGTGPSLVIKSIQGGSNISLSITSTDVIVNNTAPDQIVALTGGTGISVTGTYPNFTVTNTAPNQTVTLNDAGTTTHESLVNDGSGPVLATKGLKAGTGITLTSTATDVTISSAVSRDDSSVTALAITATVTATGLTHTLGKQFVSLTIIDIGSNTDVTREFYPILTGVGTYNLVSPTFTGTVRVLAIG